VARALQTLSDHIVSWHLFCLCVSVSETLIRNISETKRFGVRVQYREPIGKCLRRVDWWLHWWRHVILLRLTSDVTHNIQSRRIRKLGPGSTIHRVKTWTLSDNNCRRRNISRDRTALRHIKLPRLSVWILSLNIALKNYFVRLRTMGEEALGVVPGTAAVRRRRRR